jgi:hypothetical protein
MIQPSLDRRFTSATEALETLQQPDSFSRKQMATTIPTGSRFVVNQTRDRLEISMLDLKRIKSQRSIALKFLHLFCLTIPVIALSSLSVVIVFIIVYYLIANIADAVSGSVGLLLLVWLIVVFVYGLISALKRLTYRQSKRQFKLILNQQSIVYYMDSDSMFKIFSESDKSGIKIINLKRIKTIIKQFNQSTIVDNELYIYLESNKKIKFSTEENFSEPEIDWLTATLSDWLNLPIEEKIKEYDYDTAKTFESL